MSQREAYWGEAPHAAGRIEGLGDRHERNRMLVEQLDQLGEVRERPGQPVDLVDHDDVDLTGPDLGQELLQGGTLERGTREGAIVIVVGDEAPALVRLT